MLPELEISSTNILSEIIIYMKYAKYLEQEKRKETWIEICNRNMNMHIKKFPKLENEIKSIYKNFIYTKKVLPSMRALKDDTPIITKEGWKKVGEIKEGDILYSSSGDETTVLKTKSFKNKDLYKLTFSDNSNLISCGEHLWIFSTLDDLEKKQVRVNNTLFLKDHLFQGKKYKRTNIRIWNPKPIKREEKDLLIDPYILGHWLGDGYSAGYQYSSSVEDSEFICNEYLKCGYHPNKSTSSNIWTWYTHDLGTKLRFYNLIDNKHIPLDYLHSSVDQRIKLLQGLMDSDGHITKSGRCLFYNTNINIISGIKELLSSLGIKYTSIPKKKKLLHHLDGYTISFFTCFPVAQLPRKKENIRNEIKNFRTESRSIKSIEYIGKGDASCFVVDSEDHSYLAGKEMIVTHNSMQFSGKPMEINPVRSFNCSFLALDDWRAFSETMFLLLSGTGVGYSIQTHDIEKLPELKMPAKRKRRFLVGDSIEGWADAIKVLMASYFFNKSEPIFDYSDIRQKGARLITSGGKAPGPQPLKDCIYNITKILSNKKPGDKLSSLECHEIQCYIADCVLSGGIRRAAMLALFDIDDQEILTCKYGNWWENKPHLGRANNSAVLIRHKITKEKFDELWDKIKKSGCGEPGIANSNSKEYGLNPCAEVSLKNNMFCNLCEINVSDIIDQQDFNERAEAATFIGTLQASYTNFHYLRDSWKKQTEKYALLGIGMTGIASNKINHLNIKETVEIIKKTNKKISSIININTAARLTCVKPSGTSSLVLQTSSGIHAWYSQYYIRRIRVNKNEPIYLYLKEKIPELLEDDFEKPHLGSIISIPIKAPNNAIFRDENVIDFLNRIKFINQNWIKPGHINGSNTHNVSATVFIKDNEWDIVGKWMWENRDFYNGITVLPYYNGTIPQAPHEEITKEEYNRLIKYLKKINLSEILEEDNSTNFTAELACGANGCEIK